MVASRDPTAGAVGHPVAGASRAPGHAVRKAEATDGARSGRETGMYIPDRYGDRSTAGPRRPRRTRRGWGLWSSVTAFRAVGCGAVTPGKSRSVVCSPAGGPNVRCLSSPAVLTPWPRGTRTRRFLSSPPGSFRRTSRPLGHHDVSVAARHLPLCRSAPSEIPGFGGTGREYRVVDRNLRQGRHGERRDHHGRNSESNDQTHCNRSSNLRSTCRLDCGSRVASAASPSCLATRCIRSAPSVNICRCHDQSDEQKGQKGQYGSTRRASSIFISAAVPYPDGCPPAVCSMDGFSPVNSS